MELHGVTMKINDSIDSFLQRIKDSQDKLAMIDVHVDIEEILQVVLKGLSNEFNFIRVAI